MKWTNIVPASITPDACILCLCCSHTPSTQWGWPRNTRWCSCGTSSWSPSLHATPTSSVIPHHATSLTSLIVAVILISTAPQQCGLVIYWFCLVCAGLCRDIPRFCDLDPKDQAILMEEAYFDIWLVSTLLLAFLSVSGLNVIGFVSIQFYNSPFDFRITLCYPPNIKYCF